MALGLGLIGCGGGAWMGYNLPLCSKEESGLRCFVFSGRWCWGACMSGVRGEISNVGSVEGEEPACAFMRFICILY